MTPAIWFGAACALLCIMLGTEWLPAAATLPTIVSAKGAAAHRAAADDGNDNGADSKDTATWAETITGRPLFSIGRRPAKTKGGATQLAAAGMPRLSGILIGPHGRRAIFVPDSGKALVLAEGASLDDGTIRLIATDSVIVSGPKGDLVLRPSFDRNRSPTAPILPSGPMFPQPGMNGPNAFNPAFPRPGFNQGFQPPGLPSPQSSDANSDSDDASPAQPPGPPPGPGPAPPTMMPQPPPGFRNPLIPRGRE